MIDGKIRRVKLLVYYDICYYFNSLYICAINNLN